MHFSPPNILTIDDVLPTIRENPAFVVKEKGWYTVIDYLYMTDKLFNDPIERECRGLKFCTKTGKILARPYHKFHNLNERPDYATANVSLVGQPHTILDKLDGSMVHTCATDMGIYLMTRMGITEVAEAADKFLCANPIKYSGLFTSLPLEEYTYIFEYVAPSNKIVIDYAVEDLILTAIRHNFNGTYVFYDEMVKLAEAFNVPVVKHINPMVQMNTESLANYVTKLTGTEGRVIRFDTGAMVKIKCEEYVRKHRSKELIGSVKGMVGLIAENNLDDILPQLDEDVQKQVVKYTKDFLTELGRTMTAVTLFVHGYEALPQKDFALLVQDRFPRALQSVVFLVRKGCDVKEETLNLIKRNLGTNKRTTELCEQLKLPIWTFSFFSEE
jgi:RNA ligase